MGTAAFVVTGAAVFVSASPAQALGLGWSMSWSYTSNTAFAYSAVMPDGALTGVGSEGPGGTRSVKATITDTLADVYCARVTVATSAMPGFLVDKMVCGAGATATVSTGAFTGSAMISLYRMKPGSPTIYRQIDISIPDATKAPGLAAPGNGANWQYFSDTGFRYHLTGPGVRLTGQGVDGQVGDRKADTKVVNTATTPNFCVNGSIRDKFQSVGSGVLCTPGQVGVFSGTYIEKFVFAGCWSDWCLSEDILAVGVG